MKSWNIGNCATNASATVASGTMPRMVVKARLPAARAQPIAFRRTTTRRIKVKGPTKDIGGLEGGGGRRRRRIGGATHLPSAPRIIADRLVA